jgi:hypothetical protein
MRSLKLALFAMRAIPVSTMLVQTTFTSLRGTVAYGSGVLVRNAHVVLTPLVTYSS